MDLPPPKFLFDPNQISSDERQFLRSFNKCIQRYLKEPEFDINHLANHLHMSRSQLSRKVKSITGFSPGKYLLQIRLSKARFLLEEGHEPIKNIAWHCGFSSYTAFWRAFYNYFDQSPGTYARNEHRRIPVSADKWYFPPDRKAISALVLFSDSYACFHHFLELAVVNVNNHQLKLEDLASELCYSPSQLTRNVKGLLDVTPMSFVRQLRLLYAMDMIKKEGMLITEIAYRSGFSDQAHLCRCFKVNFGLSISAYKSSKINYSGFSEIQAAVSRLG